MLLQICKTALMMNIFKIITTMSYRWILSIKTLKHLTMVMCQFICHICIDHIHIIEDVFDLGTRLDIVVDELMNYERVDIQRGNHDI